MHINQKNGKVYIGQTKFGDDPNKRWRNGEGYKMSVIFYRAIQKYGWDSFDHKIIASELTQDEANYLEEQLIQQFDSTNFTNGYNIQLGGENCEWSEISKLKMAKSLRSTVREKHKAIAEDKLRERFDSNDPSVRKCTRCGVLFEVKYVKPEEQKSMKVKYNTNLPRICSDCRNDDVNKPKSTVKTCVDCGIEFICSVYASNATRCEECRLIHKQKQRKNIQSMNYD
jgi:hypothetical protein